MAGVRLYTVKFSQIDPTLQGPRQLPLIVEMNPSLYYSLLFFCFGIFDVVTEVGFSPGIDFGIALIFLGFGLNKSKGDSPG